VKELIALDEKVERNPKPDEGLQSRQPGQLRVNGGPIGSTLRDEEQELTIEALLIRAESKSAVLEQILQSEPLPQRS
jgi:hypothetical protein